MIHRGYMLEPFPIDVFRTMEAAIADQLKSYAAVPKYKWFREIAFCVLTPQGSPFNAELTLIELERRGFFLHQLSEMEVRDILRAPPYVRFHNQKTTRLSKLLGRRQQVEALLAKGLPPHEERLALIECVDGFGLKEASHALRNIGRFGFGILDRHILRALVRWGAIEKLPTSLSQVKYLEVEEKMKSLAVKHGITIDELDVFMWAHATGLIFK